MGKRRAKVWEGYEFSEDGKIAICKECRSQLVAKGSAGTSHVRRHKKICIGQQDGAAPPPGASNWEEATAVLARQDGAPPPIASPSPLGALPESSSSIMAANWEEEATTDLARMIALHGFDPSFVEDRAPPTIAPPPAIPAAPSIDAPPESSNCSKAANWEEEATADLARMIALHGYDPSIVEDSYFRSFVHRLNPDFQLPSRAAIEDICDRVCDDAKEDFESELDRTSGKVNLASGTAETAVGKVLYNACHFIDDDWNRRMMICDVRVLAPEDMGPLPLFVVQSAECESAGLELSSGKLEDFLNGDRVFSMANRRTNFLYGSKLARYETTYNHNNALQMVASCLFDEIHSDFAQDLCWCSEFKVTRQERGEFYSQLGLDYLRPYDKKWISLYLHLHQRKERKDFASPIHKSEELSCNVFGEIYRAIKTISVPNHPTSNIVLRELFKVRENLQSLLADATGDEADLYEDIFEGDVVDALEKAEKILDQSIEEEYLQWSIPLVLDPRYKLKHMKLLFIRAFSSKAKKYIANITKEIKELFTSFSMDGGGTTDEDQIDETQITSAHQLELDRYLQDPLMKETEDFDILNWWKLNSSNYPTLARMARDALAMPTSSKLSSEQMSQITSKIRGYTKGTLDWY